MASVWKVSGICSVRPLSCFISLRLLFLWFAAEVFYLWRDPFFHRVRQIFENIFAVWHSNSSLTEWITGSEQNSEIKTSAKRDPQTAFEIAHTYEIRNAMKRNGNAIKKSKTICDFRGPSNYPYISLYISVHIKL